MSKKPQKKLTKQVRRKIHELSSEGKSQPEITRLMNLSNGSVYRALKDPNPPDEEIQEEIAAGVIASNALPSDFDVEEVLSNTFNKSVQLLEKVVDEVVAGMQVNDESGRRISLKTLMDCLDKARTYQATAMKSKKSATSGTTKEALQGFWKDAAKLYIKNKEKGIEYDEKGHVGHVLDAAFREKEDNSDE